MARARIDDSTGRSAVRAAVAAFVARDAYTDPHPAASAPDRTVLATAVRYLLQRLADAAPGNSVEVRVPPFGAVQAVEGPRHTRGTPPNVVELDAVTFVAIATGGADWASAVEAGRIHASGARSDLSAHFPVEH